MVSPGEQELIPFVSETADVIIGKNTYGCGDRIADVIKKHGLSSALVVGIDTEVCVLATATELFDRGIVTYVDLSACATGSRYDYPVQALVSLFGRTIGDDRILGL